MTREPFAEGEWYHCYNRGVDKRRIFEKPQDYERFLMLLYLANSQTRLHVSDLGRGGQGPTLTGALEVERGAPLVTLGAFCLLSNHFHLLIRPEVPRGVPLFMQKVETGYSMYFNIGRGRNGALLQGKFKSRHVNEDTYLRRVINYIHANPAELYEPSWKKGIIKDEKGLSKKLLAYPYSSLREYVENKPLIAQCAETAKMFEKAFEIKDLIEEARIFARNEVVKVGP